ncbi:LEA type 2 family protein [Lentisalinibacter salinarum]|uniref:LEA type 2 family protein n=1 Tax=Lentisalinibacter salinarum TaxID=2992239 RepID=UPI003864AE8F
MLRQGLRPAAGMLVVAACLTAGGCATARFDAEPPTVRLDSVRLVDANWSGQNFVLVFAAENPNGFPLPVRSVDYAVQLAGQRFATGSATEGFTLPARGAGTFSIEVHTDLLGSASMLSALIFREGRREIDYELAGELRVDMPFARPLRFREAGRVDLARR